MPTNEHINPLSSPLPSNLNHARAQIGNNTDLVKDLEKNQTAWPMFPTSLADWRTLMDYKNNPNYKGRVYPFASSMRMEDDEVPGACA